MESHCEVHIYGLMADTEQSMTHKAGEHCIPVVQVGPRTSFWQVYPDILPSSDSVSFPLPLFYAVLPVKLEIVLSLAVQIVSQIPKREKNPMIF
jgi:hypothetical protein